MHVTRLGLTPLKGTRHSGLDHVDVTLDGPVGDRVFCLVDQAASGASGGRVLRTVENPRLLRTVATWHAGVLTTTLPGRTVEAVPLGTGETRKVDYWGRVAELEVVDGPWAAAYSAFLGREVLLARASHPGEVVYAGAVSLVTTSSLHRLAAEAGPVDPAQFRPTLCLDTTGEPAFVEEGWRGRRLRVGEAEVEVRDPLPRCAVVDLDPATGERAAQVLKALAACRPGDGEVEFGVDAVVTRPGRIEVGAPVGLMDEGG